MIQTRGTSSPANYAAQLESLERTLRGSEPGWLSDLRVEALDRFLEQGFPTTHSEAWKYTNLAPIARGTFVPTPQSPHRPTSPLDPSRPPSTGDAAIRLVFVDGRLAQDVSTGWHPDGLRVRSLRDVWLAEPDLLRGAFAVGGLSTDRSLEALHAAFFVDGALIQVPRSLSVSRPIHLVFVSTAQVEPQVSHPRVLIRAEEGSRVEVIESHVSAADTTYWTNARTQIQAGPGSRVSHYRLQEESPRAFHLSTTEAFVDRDARFQSHVFAFGAALGRNEVRVSLQGTGATCALRGLYLAGGEQHLDCQTFVDHSVPHCGSEQVYRGVLSDHARGIFGGRVLVRQDAQKSDAKQSSKSLLLSKKASANAKPQLEIYADDVRCTHGATVSQLEEDHLFYLRSRGVADETARRMLAIGFAQDVLREVDVPLVSARVEQLLRARMSSPGSGAGGDA